VPAKLWKRVVAYILDAFIISFIIVSPFANQIAPESQAQSLTDVITGLQSSLTKDLFLLSFIIGLLTLVYWSFLEYRFGQSVGKILLGIEVRSLDKKKLTLLQTITRNITKLSTLLLVLDTLYLLFKRQNQRYFEVLSGTIVVQEEHHEQGL